jgi:hypothetical protein
MAITSDNELRKLPKSLKDSENSNDRLSEFGREVGKLLRAEKVGRD